MIGTLTYITLDEFDENTPRSDQTSLTDSQKTMAIIQAQLQIDEYINVYVEPFDEDQEYKFPTLDSDEDEYMPEKVKMACVYIASDILNNNKNVLSDDANPTSEKWGDNSYSVNYGGNATNKENSTLSMPPLAVKLLQEWRLSSLPLDF